jgi:molybdopterin-guanine dinucleotide biosynthesis protein A
LRGAVDRLRALRRVSAGRFASASALAPGLPSAPRPHYRKRFTQTFPAVLDRAALSALKNELDGQRYGCFSAFQAAAAALDQSVGTVAVELLAQTGEVFDPLGLPPIRWFINLNTPEDLGRAEALGDALRGRPIA